jgi:toxin-antitoxin system PIN domain toxin
MTILDANVLVYLHNADADQHAVSWQWMESTLAAEELIGIPWHSFLAFLRITTSPGIMQRPLRLTEAAEVISGWLDNPQVVVPSPGRRFWKVLESLAVDSGTQGRGWSDAYLAALAMEHGAGLVTFDRDFRKYRGLRLVEL